MILIDIFFIILLKNIMKNKIYTVLLIIFAAIPNIYGQKDEIKLIFTAKKNGISLTLDSINIEDIGNLLQITDTMLYYPDTVLTLTYSGVGISDFDKTRENSFDLFQNYPNPFVKNTNVKLYIPAKGKVSISVFDVLGRIVVTYEENLDKGSHIFKFNPGNELCYLLSVTYNSNTKTIKMFSMNENKSNEKCEIKHTGIIQDEGKYKKGKAKNDFVYYFGDKLKYTVYAKTIEGDAGSNSIVDIPSDDTTYVFEIIKDNPCPGVPYVIYQNQKYNTVQIGTQCWLRENLNVGTKVINKTDMKDDKIIEKYCIGGKESYCDVYGGLYQWDEMMQYTSKLGSQGICPVGWHIPTDDEWDILIHYLGYSGEAGGRMKESDTLHWSPPNTGATNESSFTALPGGFLDKVIFNYYVNCRHDCRYWTSKSSDPSNARYKYMSYMGDGIYGDNAYKKDGFSVRCVKD